MLLAVLVGVSSAIAFKPPPRANGKFPPGDTYTFTVPPTESGTDITYFPGTEVNITGQVEGVDFICVCPYDPICYVIFTANTQIIENPDGSITITNVIKIRGIWTRYP
jgi:hypothetical protein